jgi:hypothetical protein
MAALTEQERAQKQAWQQRQTSSSTLPEYTSAPKKDAPADEAEASGGGDEGPQTVIEEDEMQRTLDQELLAKRKAAAAEQSAAAETAEESGEGETQEPSGDSMILFAASLFLAGVKDLIDFLSLGTLGTIINIFVTGAFTIILLMRGSKLNKSKALARYVVAAIIEFIPFLNFMPTWTISVLWEKLEKKLPASMQVVSKAAGDNKQQTRTAGEHGALISDSPGSKRDASSAQDDSDEEKKMAA